jgi:DNA-binding ferritin-like protein (Dps family)
MANPIEWIVGDLGDKKRWREYRARIKALPGPYRTAVEGVQKYLMSGATELPSDGGTLVRMFDDLADLFERAAVDGTPVRTIVGETPSEFVEEFAANYGDTGWRSKAKDRLDAAIREAEADG